MRKNTREVKIGNIKIGGNNKIAVQSMTNTDTRDVESTVKQIKNLEKAGCDIVRVAVPNIESAKALKKIKSLINIPLVADIHFDYRLAIEAINNGVDKIRINPGNIGNEEKIRYIADMAKEYGIPIRVGVNSGSLEKKILNKYNGVTAEGIVESALKNVKILEDMNFNNIVISLKTSSVPLTIESYKMMSEKVNYPLHLGITEAGPVFRGAIKSAVGIGSLLYMGIGDTIRVSLTGDPIEEVKTGRMILKSLGLLNDGVEIISCPTCGRTKINLIDLAKKVEDLTKDIKKNIKIAVMGCAVNGPGEAREADIGIAGGIGEGLIFRSGKIIKKVPEDHLLEEFMAELNKILKED